MSCRCTSQAAQCEEGCQLLVEKQRAWDAWVRVSGTYRADYGFREDYLVAKAAYDEHVCQAQEQSGSRAEKT